MISYLQGLEHFFAPWKHAYSDNTALSTSVTAAHLLSMLFGGGLAIAADRATLRLRGEDEIQRTYHLAELNAAHRPVLIAIAFSFVTGIAMLTSDLETFTASPVLWIKLGLVALLLLNGVVLERTESALRRSAGGESGGKGLWGRLKFNAIASIVLWSATLIAGITLTNTA
jgi:uncharacterized membrane protein